VFGDAVALDLARALPDLQLDGHIREFVLDGLELPDLPVELGPFFGVVDGLIETPLGADCCEHPRVAVLLGDGDADETRVDGFLPDRLGPLAALLVFTGDRINLVFGELAGCLPDRTLFLCQREVDPLSQCVDGVLTVSKSDKRTTNFVFSRATEDVRCFKLGLEYGWTQRLSPVNANVNVTMATADEQIRVSDTVKRQLDRRRREGESYNDVLQRMLEDDRDLLAGFGRWSDEHADHVREAREKSKKKSKDRMRRLADNG